MTADDLLEALDALVGEAGGLPLGDLLDRLRALRDATARLAGADDDDDDEPDPMDFPETIYDDPPPPPEPARTSRGVGATQNTSQPGAAYGHPNTLNKGAPRPKRFTVAEVRRGLVRKNVPTTTWHVPPAEPGEDFFEALADENRRRGGY